MSKRIMFIDLETQNNPYFGGVASPRHPENYPVLVGTAIESVPYEGAIESVRYESIKESKGWLHIPDDVWLVVAHNMMYEADWFYTQEFDELMKFVNRGGRLFCTALAEYRLSRQEHFYPSLDEVAPKYGGTTKIDLVKLEWERGVLTADIDKVLLNDYLVGTDSSNLGDIGNLRKVFYSQYTLLQKRGMLKTFLGTMDALLFNTVCCANGLHVDMEVAQNTLDELQLELDKVVKALYSSLPYTPEGVEAFNLGSNYHKSAWMYGGYYIFDGIVERTDKDGNLIYKKMDAVEVGGEYVEVSTTDMSEIAVQFLDVPDVTRYKSGKNKGLPKLFRVETDEVDTKKGKVKQHSRGVVELEKYPKEFQESFLRDNTGKQVNAEGDPVIGTGDDIMELLENHKYTTDRARGIIQLLRRWATLNKIIGAFFDRVEYNANGVLKKRSGLFQFITDKSLVHHSLNMTATATGRLSSARPNAQQFPRDESTGVKRMFTSRFGDDGVICEIDYTALEVVSQACFSKDKNLMDAILNGTDMHSLRASAAAGETYEHFKSIVDDKDHKQHKLYGELRQAIKPRAFAYQYGATARGIAYATGCTLEEAQAFCDNELAMFPEVEAFFAGIIEEVENNKRLVKVPLDNGRYMVAYKSYYKAPSGFEYSFDSVTRTVYGDGKPYEIHEFKPTQIRNYPIQGDSSLFVQIITGVLIRHFFKNNFYGGKCLPINTVHDAVWLDIHKDVLAECIPEIVKIMEDIPKYMAFFGYDLILPFPVEATVGANLQDQEVYNGA